MDHRQLPPRLDDLVPRCLKKLPLDPYDKEPLRYSADRKIVYSIGADLVDSGGSRLEPEEEAFEDSDEPTLRIKF